MNVLVIKCRAIVPQNLAILDIQLYNQSHYWLKCFFPVLLDTSLEAGSVIDRNLQSPIPYNYRMLHSFIVCTHLFTLLKKVLS